MADKFLNKVYTDFSGGVNRAVSRFLQADNELKAVENGEFIEVGSISKVRGYSQRGSTINPGYNVLGLFSAYKTDGTQKQIAVVDGASSSDVYTFNPTTNTWTPHILSLSTGSKAEFQSFLDGFFMVNFTEATRFNNFSAWSTSTNVTNAPKAKYVQLYLTRLYLAYTVSGGTTYPSRIYYSDLPTGTPMTISWNITDGTGNYFDVDTDNGDVIMGLGENSSRLLVFKENSLYRYDTNTLGVVPGSPGTTSSRSIKNLLGWTLFLHSSGIWGYDGTSSRILSRQIQEIIDGISTKNLTNACAKTSGDHYYVYLGDINNSKTGLMIDKCLIDFDVAKNTYSWRSLTYNPTVFEEYRDDRSSITYNDPTLTYNDADTTYDGLISAERKNYFGNEDGGVYLDNSGRTYDGTDISFTIETKDYYLDAPSQFKLFQKIIVMVNPAGKGITFQFKIDNKNWQTLGKIDKEQKELIFPAGTRGQRIKFRVIEKSGGDTFSFEGFDIYYTLEGIVE